MKKFIDWLEKGNNCLLVALAVGALICALSGYLPGQIRLLLTYDFAILTYILLLLFVMVKGNHQQLLKLLKSRKNNIRFILLFSLFCFVVNLAIVALILHDSKDWGALLKNIHLALSIGAIVLSWFLVHISFSLSYAHLYYEKIAISEEHQDHRRGIDFPETKTPIFSDFMYFAFVIGMCFQTSDVAITNSLIRQFVLGHSIISFLFVSGIFGMLINIIANVI